MVVIDTPHNGRLVATVLCRQVCRPVRDAGREFRDWSVTVAGDSDHRGDLAGGLSGDEGENIPAGREEKEKGLVRPLFFVFICRDGTTSFII
jgi:hypothetical protein